MRRLWRQLKVSSAQNHRKQSPCLWRWHHFSAVYFGGKKTTKLYLSFPSSNFYELWRVSWSNPIRC
jgi:hypothetical protein